MPYSPWLWKGHPIKALTIPLRKKGGRGSHGRIVTRGRGGGHKRRLRTLDFMRVEPGTQDVIRIEYDPGRSAHIALLRNRTGHGETGGWSYIVAPDGLRAGDQVTSYRAGIPEGLVPKWDEELRAMSKQVVLGGKNGDRVTEHLPTPRPKLLESIRGIDDEWMAARKAFDDNLKREAKEKRLAEREEMLAGRIDGRVAAISSGSSLSGSFGSSSSPGSPRQFSTSLPTPATATTSLSSSSDAPRNAFEAIGPSPSSQLRQLTSYRSSSNVESFPVTASDRALDLIHPFSSTPAPVLNKPAGIIPTNLRRLHKTNNASGLGARAATAGLTTLRQLICLPGNVVPIGLIPQNMPIHNITTSQNGKFMLCRSAGSKAEILGHQAPDELNKKYSIIKLASGEVRRIPSDGFATIGQVSK